jgi:hypothetical protein
VPSEEGDAVPLPLILNGEQEQERRRCREGIEELLQWSTRISRQPIEGMGETLDVVERWCLGRGELQRIGEEKGGDER